MKVMAFILAFIFCFMSCAICEDAATPTDLKEITEIEDDDWGIVEISFERKVYISVDKQPEFLGDVMSLTAILVDFQPEDKYIIYWQYSTDKVTWNNIENEHEQILTVIINNTNCNYMWRVLIVLEE